MSWAVPVFRAFGIPVKVHLFFFVITVGLFFRQIAPKENVVWWVDAFAFTIVLLFGIVLVHELGHAFAARWVGGEAKEILIWPLGGLSFNDLPHGWRAHFVTTAAGPAANVLVCAAAAGLLALGGFFPNLNPNPYAQSGGPYVAEMHNFLTGKAYTSVYGMRVYKAGTDEEAKPPAEAHLGHAARDEADRECARHGLERALAPGWAVWLNRAFWLSWVMLLFNLLPAYPLDGGQLLQAVVWARSDYRRGVVVAAYTGFGVAVLVLIVSMAQNEVFYMLLGGFMLHSASLKLYSLEAEDGPFGYDFSAGYTSLEKDDEPAPRARPRPGAVARWLQARKVRRLQREAERRAKDEERKELLLEKIALSGMTSLTDDERRFLEQFSARYRHRT